jgi:hypothetical protein
MPNGSQTAPGRQAEFRVDQHDSAFRKWGGGAHEYGGKVHEHGCRIHEHRSEVRLNDDNRVMYNNDHQDDLNDAVWN